MDGKYLMTHFKDVAHLYLGCKMHSDFCGHITQETLIGILNGVLIYQGNIDDGCESTSDLSQDDNPDKPILRPLSDMKEEEIKHIFGMCYRETYHHEPTDVCFGMPLNTEHFVTIKAEEPKLNNLYNWRYGLFVKKIGVFFSVDGSFLEIDTPPIFAYLLSRHFDLFGLIESGQAIDSSKL